MKDSQPETEMGSGSGARQWWQEWQLRVLVLGSLSMQFFICFSVTLRTFAIPSWLRFLMRAAYMGGDAIAFYALTILFSRYEEHHTADGGSSTLELLWAPILLAHLGGHNSIVVHSLQDYMQWSKDTTVVAFKVTVALYVILKWPSGEKELQVPVISFFTYGIVKFIEKPLYLWIGSFDKVVASLVADAAASRRGLDLEIQLQVFVLGAKGLVQAAPVAVKGGVGPPTSIEARLHADAALMMFADLPAPYVDRLRRMECVLKLDDGHAHSTLQKCIGGVFRTLYTKGARLPGFNDSSYDLPSLFIIFVCVGLFHSSHKDSHSKKDIWVTYILLCCTLVLEFAVMIIHRVIFYFPRWHGMVSQYRLMSLSSPKKKKVDAACHIMKLVRRHVQDGWNMHIRDAASYRVFNNCRGQWTLHKMGLGLQRLGWSLRVPFDKSVLLWHIATDLCFHHPETSPAAGRQEDAMQQHSREISNYMVYLLSLHPEMLMPGSSPALLKKASHQIHLIVKGSTAEGLHQEDRLAMEIINGVDMLPRTSTLLRDACRLAEALMELGDERRRWEVIQGVWVEMLCYSAARCSGYLQAKRLGDGGEFLSYPFLVWSFMGMEVFADKIQRPDPPGEDEFTAVENTPANPLQGGSEPLGEGEITDAENTPASILQGRVEPLGEGEFTDAENRPASRLQGKGERLGQEEFTAVENTPASPLQDGAEPLGQEEIIPAVTLLASPSESRAGGQTAEFSSPV